MLKRHISKTGKVKFTSIFDTNFISIISITPHEIALNSNKNYSVKNFNISIGSFIGVEDPSLDTLPWEYSTYYFRFFIGQDASFDILNKINEGAYGLLKYSYNNIINNPNVRTPNSDILDSSNDNLLSLYFNIDNPISLEFNKIKTSTINEILPLNNNAMIRNSRTFNNDTNYLSDFYFNSRYGETLCFSFIPKINIKKENEYKFDYTVNFDLVEEDF
jgi:hypothetical protein